MKAIIFATVTTHSFAENFRGHVKRELTGSWIHSINKQPKNARGGKGFDRKTLFGDDSSDFRPLAAMMLFLETENGNYKFDASDKNDFAEELLKLENAYTNYGCYCWIDGAAGGVIGGGKPVDEIDFHCKELYRCYKCVGMDYVTDYEDVSYTAELFNDPFNRKIDCSANAKQDSQNICECDKRFAENIAQTKRDCDLGIDGTCLNPEKKTISGGGKFYPRHQCEKNRIQNMNRDQCCGINPNRRPYDSTSQECCEVDQAKQLGIFGNLLEYSVMNDGTCEAKKGGKVVQSVAGNPHLYFEVQKV